MNLLTDAWIPTLQNGKSIPITITEAEHLAPSELAPLRPDFNFAVLLMLIGMRQTGYQPLPVWGDGERFLQHSDAKLGKTQPIGSLLLDEPSAIAIKNGRDFFIRGNQRNALCSCCATIALYVDAQFCGANGPGYYPGNLFYSALYLREKPTVAETIQANLIDKKIESSAYFSVPNLYWLGDADSDGECKICGASGKVVTQYWKKSAGEKRVFAENPHCAKTRIGRRYAIGNDNGTMLDIIEGGALNSANVIAPLAISETARIGDSIRVFSTFYDKATLKRLVSTSFQWQADGFNYSVLRQGLRSVWAIKFSGQTKLNRESSFAMQVMGNLSDLVMAGKSELEAAIEIFDLYCPDPGYRNQRLYPTWKYWRNMIESSINGGDDV